MHTCPYCNSTDTLELRINRERLIPGPLDKEHSKFAGAIATIKPVLCRKCSMCFDSSEKNTDYLDIYCRYGNLNADEDIGKGHFDKILELTERFINKKCSILEIGCKNGRLLKLLENKGYTSLTGYDPGADFESTEHITCVKDYFTTRLDSLEHYDCFISQSSLGFFNELHDFFGFIHKKLNAGGCFIIENVKGHIPVSSQFWFLHLACYERLARDNGFNILFARQDENIDGFLHVVMQKREDFETYKPYFCDKELMQMTSVFINDVNSTYLDKEHKDRLECILENNSDNEVVLWGTGASAFRILDCIDISILKKSSFYVVDTDRQREGRYFVTPSGNSFPVHHISSLKDKTTSTLIIGSSAEFVSEIEQSAKELMPNLKDIFSVL